MAVFPGAGHLLVEGPTPDYVHVEIGHEVIFHGGRGGSRLYPDAFVKLDLPAKGEPKEVAVTLRRGATVRGRLLGPDGKPVARAILLHRLHVTRDLSWHFPAEARTASSRSTASTRRRPSRSISSTPSSRAARRFSSPASRPVRP